MRDTQELSTGQIVRVTFDKPLSLRAVVYNGAIIREIDRKANQALVSLTLIHTQWVDASEISIPR